MWLRQIKVRVRFLHCPAAVALAVALDAAYLRQGSVGSGVPLKPCTHVSVLEKGLFFSGSCVAHSDPGLASLTGIYGLFSVDPFDPAITRSM